LLFLIRDLKKLFLTHCVKKKFFFNAMCQKGVILFPHFALVLKKIYLG
jgi:hypothetical protein